MRKSITAVLVVLIMAGATGGVIAAGGGGASGGNVSEAQYGKRTCAALVRQDRAEEAAMRSRHRQEEQSLQNKKDRKRLRREHRAEEHALHHRNVKSENQCRKNGGQ